MKIWKQYLTYLAVAVMIVAMFFPMVMSSTVQATGVDSASFNGDANYCVKNNRIEIKYHCYASSSMTVWLFAPTAVDTPTKIWTVSNNYPNENVLTYTLPANPQGLWQLRAMCSNGQDLFDYRAIGYVAVTHALNPGFDPNLYSASMNAFMPVSYDSQSPIAVLTVQAVNVVSLSGFNTLQLKVEVLYQDFHHTYTNGPGMHDNTCNCVYSVTLHIQKCVWKAWPGRHPNLNAILYGGSYATDVDVQDGASDVGGWNLSTAQSVSNSNLQGVVSSIAGQAIGCIPIVGNGISFLLTAVELSKDIHAMINPIPARFVDSGPGVTSEASVYWTSNFTESHGQPRGLNGSGYDFVQIHFNDAHASFCYKIWADVTYADGWHIVGSGRLGYWAATLRTTTLPAVYVGVPAA
jgi:hypothetical protein